MYPELLAHIARYVALTPAETQVVGEHVTQLALPRKAYLLEAGQPKRERSKPRSLPSKTGG
jgi:hypothetical protein